MVENPNEKNKATKLIYGMERWWIIDLGLILFLDATTPPILIN